MIKGLPGFRPLRNFQSKLARAMTSWRRATSCSRALTTRSKSLQPGACSASSASRAFLFALRPKSCVNLDTYEVWLPFTMCHELAHRQTVAAEDGANFCAYLACMENESPEFRYSGAIAAYVYCHNALYKADKTAASEIWQSLKEGVRADIQAANTHYAQYEGKVAGCGYEGQRYVSEGFFRRGGRAELWRGRGSSHRVVPGEKVGQNEKMSLTNAGSFCIITPAMDS